MNELAIVALTPRGIELGQRLAQALGHGDVLLVAEDARQRLQDLFQAGRPMVCIMALGIVVRLLGPVVRNKESDPAVVVVDEAGQFAVSVLGGHGAGANQLTKQVAKALGAIPVITTASDALGLPSVDLIGQEWGWKIEQREHLNRVAAAVVRGETIGVFQEAGRHDWWRGFGEWPANFQLIKSWPPQGQWDGMLAITDRYLPPSNLHPTVVYRPPSLVLGVGCRRGVPLSEIETLFQYICQTRGFSPLSLGMVATASLKANEPGLMEFANCHDVPLRTFSLEELATIAELPTPSERVRSKIGIAGVAEPAAMLAAGPSHLLVMPKYRSERITMALARREDA